MAPKTRLSRATSRNTSRPSTPRESSLQIPSSAVSEPAVRPSRKARKSAANNHARVAARPSQEETKTGSAHAHALTHSSSAPAEPPSAPPRWDEPWVEPELPAPTPTYKFDSVKGEKTYHLAPTIPLGILPSMRLRRSLGLVPSGKPASHAAAAKKKNGFLSAKSTPAVSRPGTASTSADDQAPSEFSQQLDGLRELENGVQLFANMRSNGNTSADATAIATANATAEPETAPGSSSAAGPVNGHHPLTPTLPTLKYTSEKILQIVDVAIARAEERNQPKVVHGLTRIKEATSRDQFLFAVLEGAFTQPAGSRERAVFQTLMRDAVKNNPLGMQTPGPTEMTRTQSTASTSSSLSSAKSLDAETFAPAMTPGRPSAASAPPKNKGGRPPGKGKGKGRSAPRTSSQSIFPSLEAVALRKRQRLEDPDYSDETLDVKRSALKKTFTDAAVGESHVRPARSSPVADRSTSPVTPVPTVSAGTKRTREVEEVLETETETAVVNGVLPEENRVSKRARRSKPNADEIDNNDFCHVCGGNGQLLCCDGCVDSYHFSCLDPPVDPKSPPEGQWFCPVCADKRLMDPLIQSVNTIPPKPYELPSEIRGYFEGAETGEGGVYKDVPVRPRGLNNRARGGNRSLRPEDNHAFYRLTDTKGKLITCSGCGQTSNGRRPIIQCDYCPCSWHLDCLDPPRSNPPPQVPGSDNPALYWKCPNHIDHDLALIDGLGGGRLAQIRRPRNPRFVDVEVLPSDIEADKFDEMEMSGTVYRVPEKGLILDFVRRVKRGHVEDEARAAFVAAAARAGQIKGASAARSDGVASRSSARNGDDADTIADGDGYSLAPSELDAAMALAGLGVAVVPQTETETETAAPQSEPERAERLVQQLLAEVPESVRNESNDVDILRSIQEMVKERIKALTETETARPETEVVGVDGATN
ncbi:hypothetical protein FQN50_005131 [Emmonsiellopsis sp. PD_5]|nr:hypothetical protein FQN50_005131 [Emmonsiellopsis sp. PD_5]